MDKNEVTIAFEILLEELETVVNSLNEDGVQAFQGGGYDRARQLADDAMRLTEFHEKVKGLQTEWRTLLIPGVSTGKRRRRKTGRKLPRGVRTPEEAYRIPILGVLVERGGSAPKAEVVDAVGERMKGILNSYDRQRLLSGREIRWRNATMWCRARMVQEGLLKTNSPYGIWEISEKGRTALEKLTRQESGKVPRRERE